MVICVAFDNKSDSRQGKVYVFINFQRTKICKNKTKKYSVDTTC